MLFRTAQILEFQSKALRAPNCEKEPALCRLALHEPNDWTLNDLPLFWSTVFFYRVSKNDTFSLYVH